jgi:hypothetical protein
MPTQAASLSYSGTVAFNLNLNLNLNLLTLAGSLRDAGSLSCQPDTASGTEPVRPAGGRAMVTVTANHRDGRRVLVLRVRLVRPVRRARATGRRVCQWASLRLTSTRSRTRRLRAAPRRPLRVQPPAASDLKLPVRLAHWHRLPPSHAAPARGLRVTVTQAEGPPPLRLGVTVSVTHWQAGPGNLKLRLSLRLSESGFRRRVTVRP